MKRTPYENLPFLPNIIAESVCSMPYEGLEWSDTSRDQRQIDEINRLREQMTPEQIREFADICDARCKIAYEARVKWFDKIVKAKGNRGRDQLYVWIAHWMASYLKNPECLRRSICA